MKSTLLTSFRFERRRRMLDLATMLREMIDKGVEVFIGKYKNEFVVTVNRRNSGAPEEEQMYHADLETAVYIAWEWCVNGTNVQGE